MEELLSLLNGFYQKRILVVGDICLDEYLIGKPQRLSREAPVPILEFQQRFTLPGAAANPALNIQALGGQAIMMGVIGEDEAGRDVQKRLQEHGIDISGVIVDPRRQTTVKTRVMAEVSLRFPQQLVRLDRQERGPLNGNISDRLGSAIESVIGSVHAVLISDYKSGVVSNELVQHIGSLAYSSPSSLGRTLVTVDSQGNLDKFKKLGIVKCNHMEAEAALRCTLSTEKDFEDATAQLKAELEVGGVVITRGGDGIALMDVEGSYYHIPSANRSEVYDVTGAGDTVIAVITLALTAGGSLAHACQLANYAAGIVVKRLGNATPTVEELREAAKSAAG